MNRVHCITARGLRKRYGDRLALDGVDLEVACGRVVGIIGSNGAGKSTLLRAVVGMTRTEGELRVLDLDPWWQRAALMRATAYVADEPTLPRWLRVSQALDYVAGIHPAFDRGRTAAMIERSGIQARDRVRSLSKGKVGQLQLAIAMGVDARLLVLDEPTLGLDALYRDRFYELLLTRFADTGQTVLLATHEVEEVQHILTDLVFLHEGRVVFQGSMEQFEDRFAEVHVHPEHLPVAQGMNPLRERPAMAGYVMLFDGVERSRLELLGDVRRPGPGTVLAAMVERMGNAR